MKINATITHVSDQTRHEIVATDESLRPGWEARFWNYTSKPTGDGCWIWIGPKDSSGYGQIRIGGRSGLMVLAHRLSFLIHSGLYPKRFVLHSCDNRLCVNPGHLHEGDQSDNMREMAERGRGANPNTYKTHCKRGHPFDETNTKWWNGWRYCRTCQRDYEKKRIR
jgi:hypothetical protein